jgi:hypothetical protein
LTPDPRRPTLHAWTRRSSTRLISSYREAVDSYMAAQVIQTRHQHRRVPPRPLVELEAEIKSLDEDVQRPLMEVYVNRTGFRRGSVDRVQAATATCWSAEYAVSYPAGGTSAQAEWSRAVFHQWTHAAVSISTCSTVRQGPLRLMSSVL